jgi:hypothetical protein
VRKPGYQTAEIVKFSVEMGNAGLARATKHTLNIVVQFAQFFVFAYLAPK